MPSAISAAIWIISFRVGGGRPGLFCRIQDGFSISDLQTQRFTHSFHVTLDWIWILEEKQSVFLKAKVPFYQAARSPGVYFQTSIFFH